MAPSLSMIGAASTAPTFLEKVCYGRICNSDDLVYVAGQGLGRHQLVIGASGRGKSNFLAVLWRQIVLANAGGGIFFDPHGGEFRSFI